MTRTLLEFSGVSKRFCRRPETRGRLAAFDIARELCGLPPGDVLRDGEFWSLRGIDLEVVAGEVLGVIGHNGAGKSTLMNLAAGTLRPTVGTITSHARSICKIDPFSMMSPLETARENIILQLVYHGVPPREIDGEVKAIAAFADLDDHLDETVGTYSTGMRGRLGFAIFSRMRPDVFLVDEAIGGGDHRFRDQFSGYLERYVADGGAMLLCSHSAPTIQTLCDRVLLLDHGRLMLISDPATAIDAYNTLAAERGALPMPGFRRQAGGQGQTAPPAPSGSQSAAEAPSGLRVVDARIAGVDGGDPVAGAGAEIVVRCASEAPVDRVVCSLEIGRDGWFPLAVIEAPSTSIRPEGTDLTCRIATLPLAPGHYDMHVRLADADSGGTLADTSGRAPFRLQVRDAAPKPRVGREGRPVVHVSASWQTSPASETSVVSPAGPS